MPEQKSWKDIYDEMDRDGKLEFWRFVDSQRKIDEQEDNRKNPIKPWLNSETTDLGGTLPNYSVIDKTKYDNHTPYQPVEERIKKVEKDTEDDKKENGKPNKQRTLANALKEYYKD